MIFDYEGYRIIQDDENYRSISIVRNEKEVMHLNVTKLMTEGELIEAVDACLKALKTMSMAPNPSMTVMSLAEGAGFEN